MKVAFAIVGVLTALSSAASPSRAADSVAVFPFELLDTSQDGELFIKVRPEETKRLELLTGDLKARLGSDERFAVADIGPLEAEISKAAPLFKCNGCESDLVKKSGAKLAMLGLVQKFSDTLLSVSIQVLDVGTGEVKSSYSAGVQGNTDEAWLRGLRYIVKNKIANEGTAQ
jgi:hypothetical protein